MRIKKIPLILAVVTVLTVLLSACSGIENKSLVTKDQSDVTDLPPIRQPYPVSFDNESFDAAPSSCVSLSPAITGIMYDLYLGDRLIGVSDYCFDPDGDKSRVGSPAKPDIDKIIGLAPELVITQSPLASTDIIRLKQAGIRVLYMELPRSFAYLCEEYARLAMIFYGAIDSKDVAASALTELDNVMSQASQKGLSITYIVVNEELDDGYGVATDNCIEEDILSVFGENLLKDSQGVVTKSELKELEPQIIFVSPQVDGDYIASHTAGNGKVVELAPDSFLKPTADLAQTVNYIMSALG